MRARSCAEMKPRDPRSSALAPPSLPDATQVEDDGGASLLLWLGPLPE